jgi:hypothetical protein
MTGLERNFLPALESSSPNLSDLQVAEVTQFLERLLHGRLSSNDGNSDSARSAYLVPY